MALGQMIGAIASIESGAYLNMKPPAGVEYVIHNITISAAVTFELYFTDGVNDILIEDGDKSIVDVHYHASNALYYKVKNTSGTAALIGFDGVCVYEG